MKNYNNIYEKIITERLGIDPDRIPTPQGHLDIYVKEKGKIIYEDHGPNQVMTWMKLPLAFLLGGYIFSSFGEHVGYLDDAGQMEANPPYTPLQQYYVDSVNGVDNPPTDSTTQTFGCPWRYQTGYIDNTANGQDKPFGVYDRLVYNDISSWQNASNPQSNHQLNPGDNVYPFMITKFKFGKGGIPGASIDPDRTVLEDSTDNNGTPLPFVMIKRDKDFHIKIDSTQGSKVNNRTTFSVTLPDLAYDYPYDGIEINEVGLYISAGFVPVIGGTPNHDLESGALVAKRYFNAIKKESSVSFTFVWSIYF